MQQTAVLKKTEISGREEQIQFLRFLAFLNVFIAHAEVWLFFEYPASHCSKSAVCFFLILSGALAGYAGYGREVVLNGKSIGTYLWKKLRRLYPLYAATMVVCVLLSDLPGRVFGGGLASSLPELWQLGKNLLLIQSWFPEGYYSINGVGWFLSTLMFLYLWTLPVLRLLNALKNRRYCLLWLGGFLGSVMFAIAAYCYATQHGDMEYLHYILPPARLGEYVCGMILGFGIREIKPRMQKQEGKKWLFTLLEGAALVFWFVSLKRPGNYWMNRTVSWLIPNLALTEVFLAGMGGISDLFRRKPLVRLGDISFACFLIHNILIIRVQQYNEGYFGTAGAMAAAFCLTLGVTVFLAFLLTPELKKR